MPLELLLDCGKWAALIFGVLTLLRLRFLLKQWRAVRRVYGRIPWSLVRHMLWYVRKSPAGFLVGGALFCLPVTIVLVVRVSIHNEPLEYLLFPLAAQAYFLVRVAEFVLPPTILLLGTSVAKVTDSLCYLNIQLPHHRTVALLRGPREWAAMGPLVPYRVRTAFHFNNLRTANDYEWRSVAFHLMDVVPIIVIDADTDSAAFAEELRRIRQKGYHYRAVFMGDAARVELGPIPCVERTALVDWVTNYLARLTDCDERLRRQAEITAMIAGLPLQYRNPQNLDSFVAKTRSLVGYELQRFIRRCRATEPPQWEMPLLEDIPAAEKQTSELRAFRTARGLEEVEILLISAREWVMHNPGPVSGYNLAICCNSLGHLARLRGEWDEAIRLIREAIQHFEAVADAALQHLVLGEFAVAYFNLAEVYMVRLRETGDPADCAAAVDSFQRSIEFDRQSNGVIRLTECRLRALAGESYDHKASTVLPPQPTARFGQRIFHPSKKAMFATLGWVMLPALFLAGSALWLYWKPPEQFRWVSPKSLRPVLACGAVLFAVYAARKIPLTLKVHSRPLVIDDEAVSTRSADGRTLLHAARDQVAHCIIKVRPNPFGRTDRLLILNTADGSLALNYVLSILSRADEQAALAEIQRWSPVAPEFIRRAPP